MNYTPEEIAELLKDKPHQPHYIAAMVRKAVEAEREACAKVCEKRAMHFQSDESTYAAGKKAGALDCMMLIRAR